MNKRIFCALLAALMIVLMLPVQAFAATEEIKGAYVGQKFESVIGTVLGAKTFSKSGDIPEGLKVSGAWSYKNTFGDYVLKVTLEGKPTKAGTYNFSVNYKGIRLTYGMSIDYLAYAGIWQETNQRGCTVIKYAPNGSFECKAENYYQDKYVAQFEKQ